MVQVREVKPDEPTEKLSRAREANWPAVLFFIHIHLLSLYGVWILFYQVKFMTFLLLVVLTAFGILGVTAGAHRLWAHRSYKATPGLRIFLMLLQTLSGQGPIYDWVQYHRLHHQLFGTEADPYNHVKGFLHCHLITRVNKLSELQSHMKDKIDMSDIENDSVVMFQKKTYWLLYGIFFLLLPLNAPLEYWGETVVNTVFVIGFLRYLILLHAAWLVESGIEVWGLKPGEKYPHDSNSVFILSKTFWPHYHYLVPSDYKTGEFGTYDGGCTTAIIRVMAALGLATNLQTMETSAVQKALALAAKTKRPITECLKEALEQQVLSAEHYLHRS